MTYYTPVAKFHEIIKLVASDEQFEGYFSYNTTKQRYAISVGDFSHVFSKLWAQSLVESFLNSDYPIENGQKPLNAFLTEARKLWISSIDWSNLKWYHRNSAIGGSYASFSGLEINRENSLIRFRGFSSNYQGIHVASGSSFPTISATRREEFAASMFWSGYSPPIRGDYRWSLDGNYFFSFTLKEHENLLMCSPAISEWISVDPARRAREIIESDDPSVMARRLMKRGEIENADSIIAVIKP